MQTEPVPAAETPSDSVPGALTAPHAATRSTIPRERRFTMLAPMQDVTTLAFMQLIARRGAPDLFVTEFLRVHATSELDDDIADCAARVLPLTGTPLLVQLIGEDVPALVRAAETILSRFAETVAGIDFNLGCPMRKIFRKNVGGGLLRDLPKVAEIFSALREICSAHGKIFSVKCRLGFDDASPFPRLLELVRDCGVDLLAVHARTVRGLYRSPVDYAAIAEAVEKSACAVVANGEISSVGKARFVLEKTHCAGLMCGRHAVRNPWIFRQLREMFDGTPRERIFAPRLGDVFEYIRELEPCIADLATTPARAADRMKKFLNFIGTGVDPNGDFLRAVRRADSPTEIFKISEKFLLAGTLAEQPFPPEPFPRLCARPNCE